MLIRQVLPSTFRTKSVKYVYFLLISLISNNIVGQIITEKLESEINRRVEIEINPSFAIGVLLPDGTTQFYNYGYFDSTQQQPDSLTLYEIGSVTKTFTAALARTYLEDSLQTPLPAFLPTIKNPNLKRITPYALRNHTAGIPRLSRQFSPQNWSDPFNGYSVDILYDELKHLSPDTSRMWSYSNFGYGILGQAIEITTGKSYDILMDSLLHKIGMENTFLHLPADYNQNIAQPTNIGTLNSNWNFTGPARYAGGLVSNTKDLLSYLKYEKQINPLFISDSISMPIQTGVPNLGKDRLFYKDGWFVLKPDSTTNILLHNGGTGGFISFIGYNKTTETGVAVLSNSVNIVDDIGVRILYPTFALNRPKRTIAYELAEDIDAGKVDSLVTRYDDLKSEKYPNNVIDIYWLERFHFGKGHYSISNQLSDIMVQELPDDWEVHDIKGQNLEQLGAYKKAIKAYEKALALNPEMEMLQEKIERCAAIYEH